MEPLVQKLVDLKRGITGGQLISMFMRRRIQPLQHWVHPMWRYTGLEDPTRCSPKDILGSDLLFRIQHVTKCMSTGFESSILPYAADTALLEVFPRVFVGL